MYDGAEITKTPIQRREVVSVVAPESAFNLSFCLKYFCLSVKGSRNVCLPSELVTILSTPPLICSMPRLECVAVTSLGWTLQRSYSTSGPVSTGTGTIFGRAKPPQYFTKPPAGQLSLLPSVVWEMSTSQSAVMLCGCGVKARYGSVHLSISVLVWQVKLCDPSLTRAIPERGFMDGFLMIKIYGYFTYLG